MSLSLTRNATTVLRHKYFFKNHDIILFGNRQGINPMGLSVTLTNYKNKQFFTNTKMSLTKLRRNIKMHKGWTKWAFVPLGRLLFSKLKKNLDNKTQITICWKYLYHSQKNCKGLTQWAFVTLGPTLIYATENLLTLTTKTNWMNLGRLNLIQSIHWWWKLE